LTPLPASAARIVTRLLLGWALLVVAGVAMAQGNAGGTGQHVPFVSAHGLAFDEPGHADRDDASCSKAPAIQQIHESNIAKAEAEPEFSLDSVRLTRCALATCVPQTLRDATCTARRNAPLGRGPPRVI